MAKFCSSCGAQLDEAAKFCPGCGTQQVQAQQPNVPQYQQSYAPPPSLPKKKSKAPLIVGGAIALVVLIVAIALAGRKDNSPTPTPPGYNSGGIPTAGGNPGQATQPPATQPQQPGGNIDHAIVGYWASTNFLTYSEINSGNYAYSTQSTEGWIFNSDGTFHLFFHTSGTRQLNGLSQYKGNYRIEGDRIYFTNVMSSWKNYDKPGNSCDFETSKDFMITYEFQDNGKAMSINKSNIIGDYSSDAFRTYLHFIEE